MVVLNAAAAIMAADLEDDFASAVEKPKLSIDYGKAKECLEDLIKISNS